MIVFITRRKILFLKIREWNQHPLFSTSLDHTLGTGYFWGFQWPCITRTHNRDWGSKVNTWPATQLTHLNVWKCGNDRGSIEHGLLRNCHDNMLFVVTTPVLKLDDNILRWCMGEQPNKVTKFIDTPTDMIAFSQRATSPKIHSSIHMTGAIKNPMNRGLFKTSKGKFLLL